MPNRDSPKEKDEYGFLHVSCADPLSRILLRSGVGEW